MQTLIQLLIVGVWLATLSVHLRRLYRIASVPAQIDRERYLRTKAERMWWWLGREEFWRNTQRDIWRCLEANLMVIILAVGL